MLIDNEINQHAGVFEKKQPSPLFEVNETSIVYKDINIGNETLNVTLLTQVNFKQCLVNSLFNNNGEEKIFFYLWLFKVFDMNF